MKYRKISEIVEARELREPEAPVDIANWCGGKVCGLGDLSKKVWIEVETREGTMRADYGDFIIKGVWGDFYIRKPHIFVTAYEPVEEPDMTADYGGLGYQG